MQEIQLYWKQVGGIVISYAKNMKLIDCELKRKWGNFNQNSLLDGDVIDAVYKTNSWIIKLKVKFFNKI